MLNKFDDYGVQITVWVHVDDLLVTSVSIDLHKELDNHLRKKYGTITMKKEDVTDYMGMSFDFFEKGKVRITMKHCVQDILSNSGVEGEASSPPGEHLFDVEDLPLATEEDRKWFHSHVAKMLYLSKRVKPECLPTVILLASCVSKRNIEDMKKLKRLLKYRPRCSAGERR